MSNYKLSIVAAVYNLEKYLPRCLDALVNQTLQEIEILCVDDGSTDSAPQIIDEYAKKYPNKVKAFHKTNGGEFTTRNYGLERATGEYVTFVDTDDYVEKTWAEKLYNVAKENDADMAVLADSLTGKGVNETVRQIQKVMEEDMQKMADKGRIGRKIRVMIVGIPNVGKSSFINRIAKKTSAEVGNKPGVTKQKQWIRINEKIELLDTPGVLWPKFENEKVAMNLAITGTIKDDILELTEVAYTLTKFMLENYRNNLLQRYSLDEKQINEILNQEQAENENIYEIMQLIGKKRGAILGGRVDDERTSKLILDDFRSSKLGKITLEIPE